MIKDQIRVYQNFQGLKSCPFCRHDNHFVSNCPHLNFVPDKGFILTRFTYTVDQKRRVCGRRIKRDMNALKSLMNVNVSALKCDMERENVEIGNEPEASNVLFPRKSNFLFEEKEKEKFRRRATKMREAIKKLGDVRMNQKDNLGEPGSSDTSDGVWNQREGGLNFYRKSRWIMRSAKRKR